MTEFVLQDTPDAKYEIIPDGEIMSAIVDNCEQRPSPWLTEANGDPVQQVAFRFRITEEGPFFDRVLFGDTPVTFTNHSDCKLRMWVQELLAEDTLPAGFRFNTDTLIGLPCRVVVGEYTSKAGKQGNKAQDILRAKLTSAPLASEIF